MMRIQRNSIVLAALFSVAGTGVFAGTLLEDDFSTGGVPGGFVMVDQADTGRLQSQYADWAIRDGALSNTAIDRRGERGVAWLIDLASLESGKTRINISFDHVSGNAEEKLFIHLYGYVRVPGSTRNLELINILATNGNAWTLGADTDKPETDPFRIYNFVTGRPQGASPSYRGESTGAFEVDLDGSAGSFVRSFDLSGMSAVAGDRGPLDLADYDYFAIAFTRDVLGTDPSIRIDNLVITADKPGKGTVILISSFGSGFFFFGCGALALRHAVPRRLKLRL